MIDFIDRVLEPWLWMFADWSLRWAMLIVVLAVWLLVVRPRRSGTRYLLCSLVLLAGLVLPALPRWGAALAIATARSEGPPKVVDLPTVPWENVPPTERSVKALAVDRPAIDPIPADSPAANRSSQVIALPSAAEPLGAGRIIILSLAIFWSVAVGSLLIRRLGGWLLLERMRRTADPLEGPPLETFQECRTRLHLRRQAILASHAMVRSPVTLGLRRPMILVPPSWIELPELAQRASLLHELAHLARYDDWTALLLEIVRTVFFFHPLVHWLLGRIEYERELLCDEAAVAQGIDAHEYASVLLEFSRQPGRLRAAFVGPAYLLGFGHKRSVKARINRLLEANMNRWMSPLPTRRAIGLGMVALALALALGSFRVRTIETRADTESPTAKHGLVAPPEDADKAKNIEPEVTNRVEPYSVLKIRALGVDPANPVDGEYLVEPSGKIDLGPAYGRVDVAGLSFEEAEIVVQKLLKETGIKNLAVSLTLAGWVTKMA